MKAQFDLMRVMVRRDMKDGHDRDSAAMASAMIDVAEELMSKLERIAVAAETIANTTAIDHYGQPSVRTSQA